MPIKCQSNQIYTERYVYTMGDAIATFLPIKARHQEVVVVHQISIYNPTGNGFTHIYKVMKRRGQIYRLTYAAALATLVVLNWDIDVYLIDGDECGVILTPSGAGDIVEVTFQCIRMRDDEYFKAT